jgi:hypothetical protein
MEHDDSAVSSSHIDSTIQNEIDTSSIYEVNVVPVNISGTIKKRKRPARKQADEQDVFEDPPHTGLYNIWYDRVQDYSTWRDRRDAKLAGKRFKLEVEKDIGETQAKKNAYICLYFARGKCVHGHNCKYKHQIPTKSDQEKLDLLHDCFGRERHRTDRDDMGGVGSFNRDNHTLYVGGIRMVANVEEVINKHFGKFGEILNLRILHGRSIAFITYRLRVSAEFAKEAMSDQSIIGNEVLNVRWANEDPNPQVQHQKQDKLRAEAWEQMQQTNPNYFKHYELLSQEQYPNTDAQYPYYVPPPEKSARRKPSEGPNWDAAQREPGDGDGDSGDESDEEEENTSPQEVVPPPVESSDTGKDEGDTGVEQPVEQSDEQPDDGNKDPKEVEYEAWQNFYAQLNYPGYYDKSGRYHRYDPKYFDPVKHAQQYKQQQRQQQQQLQQQKLQQQYQTDQQEEVYDYYQYYASYPVPDTQSEPSDYYNHFRDYGQGDTTDNEPPVYYSDTALPETSDAPLYPPQ